MPIADEITDRGHDWFVQEEHESTEPQWDGRHVALTDDTSYHQWFSVLEHNHASELEDKCNVYFAWWPDATDTSDSRNRVDEIVSRSKYLEVEFDALSKRWIKDTRHLSLVSQKIIHPAYLRIIGMGEPAIPLLLKSLRDRPSHWFMALRATTNIDPGSIDDSPAEARQAWLLWGIKEGYIE